MARTGLPKSIAKKYGISKKAWRIYRGRKGSNPKRKTSKRKVKKTARRRYTRRRRGRRKKTIPLLPILGVAAGTNAFGAWGDIMAGNIHGFVEKNIAGFTGFSINTGDFDPMRLMHGLMPAIAGALAHKVLNMLGVNRSFANLPSPLNKLRL